MVVGGNMTEVRVQDLNDGDTGSIAICVVLSRLDQTAEARLSYFSRNRQV